MSDTVFHLANRAKNIKGTPSYQPYSKVRIIVGNDDEGNQLVYEAGNDSARTLEITNPYGTQALANEILARLSGFEYAPYTADGALLDPAAELGDGIAFTGDIYSFISSSETTLSPIMSANVAAYEDGELNHEYPYETRESKELARKFNGLRTDFIVELGHVESRIEETYETKSEASSAYSDINQTINDITLSVSRDYQTKGDANAQYENLSASIGISAKQIKSTVAAATNKYYTTGVTIHLYGYGTPDSMGYKASDYNGKTYLDQATGYYYTSNGSSWVRNSNQLQTVDSKLESSIVQTADSIKSTVASSTSKYDLTALPSGVSINYYGYGTPTIAASGNTNKYYLDQSSGFYYKSNGSTWVRQNSTSLPLITDVLSSTITQTANQITAQVNGIYAPEWNNNTVYAKGDVVKRTNGTTVTYYQAKQDNSGRQPPNSTYWRVVSAPTVQSMVNLGLDGLTLGYRASTLDNSATITLNSNGIQMDAQTITMTNVVADSISAYAYIESPNIYGGRYYDSNGKAYVEITSSGDLRYRSGTTTGRFFDIIDDIGVISFYAYGDRFMYYSDSTQTVKCVGNWDFSLATVTGLPSSS